MVVGDGLGARLGAGLTTGEFAATALEELSGAAKSSEGVGDFGEPLSYFVKAPADLERVLERLAIDAVGLRCEGTASVDAIDGDGERRRRFLRGGLLVNDRAGRHMIG